MNQEFLCDVVPFHEHKDEPKVIDSHFHFHNEGIYRWDVKELMLRFERLQPFFRKHKDARLKRIDLRSQALTIVPIIMDIYSSSQRYEIKDLLLANIRKVSKVTIDTEYVKGFPPFNSFKF